MASASTTYTVEWSRPDGEMQSCSGLDLRTAFARLRAAIRSSGPITVHRVTTDHTKS